MNPVKNPPYAPTDRPALTGNPMAAVGMNDDGVTNGGDCGCDGPPSPFKPGGGLGTEDVLGAIFKRMGMPEDDGVAL